MSLFWTFGDVSSGFQTRFPLKQGISLVPSIHLSTKKFHRRNWDRRGYPPLRTQNCLDFIQFFFWRGRGDFGNRVGDPLPHY